MNPYDVLNKILSESTVPLFGWTLLQQPLTIGFYKEWLDQNNNGTMEYLKTHFEKKEHPELMARSALVIGIPYVPHPFPLVTEKDKLSHLRRAAYSQGADYHYWLKEKLNSIIANLQESFPNEEFIPWTDSGPVLERDLAYRSGLGWFGKNTCLIDRKQGSLFLIGEIYTTLYLENKNPLSADFCGSCNRCVEACPTQAIESTRHLNAKKCISYWTIESKEIPPLELRNSFHDWIFGCDVCQMVCPWNKEVLRQFPLVPLTPLLNSEKSESNQSSTIKELKWILNASNKELQKALLGTPFARAAGNKLKRNALIVIGNLKIKDLEPDVQKYTEDLKLQDLAQWCLGEIHK